MNRFNVLSKEGMRQLREEVGRSAEAGEGVVNGVGEGVC